ncbi:MAG: RICIN domain-containing protein [Clostridia bacterium]|nr:RICIN domain-containing protein [Clostridia bacterium]
MKKRILSMVASVLIVASSISAPIQAASPEQSGKLYEGTANVAAGMRNACVSPRVVQLKHQKNPEDNGKYIITFEVGRFPYELEEIFRETDPSYTLPEDIDPLLDAFPVYEGTDNPDGTFTWTKTPVGYVQDSKNGWGYMNCPQIFELPQDFGEFEEGTLLCVGNSVNIPNDLTPHTMDMCYSTDLGRTWHYYSTIAFGGKNQMRSTPLWEPHLLMYNNELHCYFSDETHPDYSQKLAHKSTKDGKVWSDFITDLKVPGQRPGMTTITKLHTEEGEEERWALLYEARGGAATYLKFGSDPTAWDEWDEGIYVGPQASPYITTLDTGAVVHSRISSTSLFVNSRKDALGEWIEYRTTGIRSWAHNKQLYQMSSGNLMVLFGNTFNDYNTDPSSLNYATYDLNTTGLFKDDEYVYITNSTGAVYVSHKDGEWAEGTLAHGAAGTGTNHWDEKMVIEAVGDNEVKIQGAYSGRLLSVTSNTSSVMFNEESKNGPEDYQVWKMVENSDGTVSFINKATGKAMDMQGTSIVLSQTDYTDGEPADTQKFKLEECTLPLEPYNLTVTNKTPEGGILSLQDTTFPTSVAANHHVRIVPYEGYKISSVLLNGVEQGAIERAVISPTKGNDGMLIDQVLEVTFEETEIPEVKTVNYSAYTTAGGAISPAEKGSMSSNSKLDFTITPEEGYIITDLTINGESRFDEVVIEQSGKGVFTMAEPWESFKIIAFFEKNPVKSIVFAPEAFVYENRFYVESGKSYTATITPSEGELEVDCNIENTYEDNVLNFTADSFDGARSITIKNEKAAVSYEVYTYDTREEFIELVCSGYDEGLRYTHKSKDAFIERCNALINADDFMKAADELLIAYDELVCLDSSVILDDNTEVLDILNVATIYTPDDKNEEIAYKAWIDNNADTTAPLLRANTNSTDVWMILDMGEGVGAALTEIRMMANNTTATGTVVAGSNDGYEWITLTEPFEMGKEVYEVADNECYRFLKIYNPVNSSWGGSLGELRLTGTFEENANAVRNRVFSSFTHDVTYFVPACTDIINYEFDAIALYNKIDGFIGFMGTDNEPYTWDSYNCVIRFNKNGYFDARNGSAFGYKTKVTYTAGNIYHITGTIDMTNKTYSVYVDGIAVAENYAFRANSPATDDIAQYALKSGDKQSAWEYAVENMRIYESIVGSVERDGNTVTVYSLKDKDVIAVMAEYDGDILVKIQSKPLELKARKHVSVTYENMTNLTGEVKVFLLESIEGMVPVAKAAD